MANQLNVLAVNEYEDKNGEMKNAFTQVGVAFPTKKANTFTLVITPAIAISGRLLICPPKGKEDADNKSEKRQREAA